MISIIAAPESAPQVYAPSPQPPPSPRLEDTDRRIIDTVRDQGPVKFWSLLNWLTEDQAARSRAEGRQARLNVWRYRIQRLKSLGLIFGRGRNEVAATKPPQEPTRRRRRGQRPTVAPFAPSEAVSAGHPQNKAHVAEIGQPFGPKVSGGKPVHGIPTYDLKQTQTAPSPEMVSSAAAALARLPRRADRRWSGWITDQVRTYRNMVIELPSGERVYAFGALRGQLVFTREIDGPAGDPFEAGLSWGVIKAERVRVPKNQNAVVLGRLKRGAREKRSEAKIRAARRNGCAPARPGSRPRGRPRGYPPRDKPKTSAAVTTGVPASIC